MSPNRTCETAAHEDSGLRDFNKDAAIIVLGLIAAISTLMLICMCAVCRMHIRCGVLPKWLIAVLQTPAVPIKNVDDLSCTDTAKLVTLDSISPTSETHNINNSTIDMTSIPSMYSPVHIGDSHSNETATRNSTYLNYDEEQTKYESIRRTSLPLLQVRKSPYFNINTKKKVKAFGSQVTLNKLQTPEIIQLPQSVNHKLLSSAPDSSKGSAPQTPEVAQLSPSANARLLSSEPNSRRGSPTLTPKLGSPKFLAELNALLPILKTAASTPALKNDVVEYNNSLISTSSVYSLASHNSKEKIASEEESIYSNDGTEKGTYSHLNPFGNQKKLLQNVYDG